MITLSETGTFQNKFMNIVEYFLVVSVTVEVITFQQCFCIISQSYFMQSFKSYIVISGTM